ncbi:MAG: 50S ribosomal protein L21 [Deltaproteobacteria bacterium]|nr:MAG: 50S ribosomal protein L21 [Deltaproteobacteria bacterium]
MYAVVRTGGKQYRVAQGDRVDIEKIAGEVGQEVTLDDVLMIGGNGDTKIGTPRVEGASVTARIIEQGRGKKVLVFKFKRRKDYKKMRGHRQYYTRLEITGISAG